MSKLTWDSTGERYFELGVSKGVLYPYNSAASDATKAYGPGVAWNGLTGVDESPDGADANDLWADNFKYGSLRGPEDYKGKISAYQYPDEFAACDGSASVSGLSGLRFGQQKRQKFGFCYRTNIGDDTDPSAETNYKLHLVYGATASPSDRSYETVNDNPDAMELEWDFETVPEEVGTTLAAAGIKPTAYIVIDSREFTTTTQQNNLKALEEKLYGRDADTEQSITALEPYLPLPAEVYTTLSAT